MRSPVTRWIFNWFLDRASLEIFGNHGLFYIALNRPGILKENIQIDTDNGIDTFRVSELKSAW